MLVSVELEELAAAQAGDQTAFGRLAKPYRGELTLHGYRMLGSLQDAEDVAQEALLRAWTRLETFKRQVSFRAWLYKIATNLCIDRLRSSPRKLLPRDAGEASPSSTPIAPPPADPIWLDPLPDSWWEAGPEQQAITRESVSLAFLTALHSLSPRQRAVLILCDVLDWSARETAELLEISVSAVNSVLHRARKVVRVPAPRHPLPRLTHLLERYVKAWEKRDVVGLVALLKEDAAFTMPPTPTWYQGRADIATFIENHVFAEASWRLVPASANGQPAFGLYRSTPDGWIPYLLQVLTLAEDGELTEVISFLDPGLFPRFGLSLQLT